MQMQLQRLHGANYVSFLDINSAFLQMPLKNLEEMDRFSGLEQGVPMYHSTLAH